MNRIFSKESKGFTTVEVLVTLAISTIGIAGAGTMLMRLQMESNAMIQKANARSMQVNAVRAAEQLFKGQRIVTPNAPQIASNYNNIGSYFAFTEYQAFSKTGQTGTHIYRNFTNAEQYWEGRIDNRIKVGTIRNVCYTPDPKVIPHSIKMPSYSELLNNGIYKEIERGSKLNLWGYYDFKAPLGQIWMYKPLYPPCQSNQLSRVQIEYKPFNVLKKTTVFPPPGEKNLVISMMFVQGVYYYDSSVMFGVDGGAIRRQQEQPAILLVSGYIEKMNLATNSLEIKWRLDKFGINDNQFSNVQFAIEWPDAVRADGFPALTKSQESD